MAGNQVTLTFAADTKQAEDGFSRVGASAKSMSDDVGRASEGFDKADKAAGSMERGARGLGDAITGTQDTMKGAGALLRGDFSAESFMTVGAGVAGLGGAMGDLIIPLGKSIIQFGAAKVAMLGHAVASGAVKVATVTWTAVQWLLNAALTANPIGLIIVAIGILIGIIVWIATKTTWFQDIWSWAWERIKLGFMVFWELLKLAWSWIGSAFDWFVGLFQGIPGMLSSAFSGLFDIITWPFRTAFNFVADIWNNTIGKLSWTVPSWVPIIGGNTISVPKLNKFHSGGVVPGPIGQEVLAVLQAGERVSPVGSTSDGRGGGGGSTQYNITVHNPKPERASESIASTMARVAFLAPGGAPA